MSATDDKDQPAEVVLNARDETGKNLLHVALANEKGSKEAC